MITRLPRRRRPGLIWKRLLKTLLVMAVVVVLMVTLAVNLFFTPEKLKKLVDDYAIENLQAEVLVGNIELSVFSAFPSVRLEMDSIKVVSHVFCDTTLQTIKRDSLFSARQCVVEINAWALLAHKVVINEFLLDSAQVYAYVDKSGRANWEIMKTDTISMDTEQEDSISSKWKPEVEKLSIRNGFLIFDDRTTSLYTRLTSLDIDIEGDVLTSNPRLLVDLDLDDLLVWQAGDLLVKKTSLGMASALSFIDDSMMVRIDSARCHVNGVKFKTEGTLRPDTLTHACRMDLRFGMQIDSLVELIDMVPEYLLKKNMRPGVIGQISCIGTMQGLYGNGNYPLFKAEIGVKDGSIAYPGMDYKVEELRGNFFSVIDLEKKQKSYITLDSLYIRGGNSELNLSGRIENLLEKITYHLELDADVNLDDITHTFPLTDSIVCKGIIKASVKGKAYQSDLLAGNYGRIRVGGQLKMDSLNVFIPKDSIIANVKHLNIGFGTNRGNVKTLQGVDALAARVGYSDMILNVRHKLTVLMDTSVFTLNSSSLYDTTMIATVSSTAFLGKTVIVVKDTLLLGLQKALMSGKLLPSKRDKTRPRIETKTHVEDLRLRLGLNRLTLEVADIEYNASKSTKVDMFVPSGEINFTNLRAYSPFYPLRIKMPGTQISFSRREINFKEARLIVGKSDMELTGQINNMWRAFLYQDTIHGELHVRSHIIDCNQLFYALDKGEEHLENIRKKYPKVFASDVNENIDSLANIEPDSIYRANGVLVLPPRVTMKMDIDADKVLFGGLILDTIRGNVLLKDQAFEVTDMKLRTAAADVYATGIYKANDPINAYTGFDMRIKQVHVDSLIGMMHDLDTLLPMLHSFAGKVDFSIAAEMTLDSNYSIDKESLNGAASLDGKDMVLMDGETFAEISKLLMFKNKERNQIDSVSVDMKIERGTMEIYPFMLDMDRYKVAIGGTHDIDMNFKYHITIFRPQLIASTVGGLSIKGNIDDLKFYPTKAKYRDNIVSRRAEIDSSQLNLRNKILGMLQDTQIKKSEVDEESLPSEVEKNMQLRVREHKESQEIIDIPVIWADTIQERDVIAK